MTGSVNMAVNGLEKRITNFNLGISDPSASGATASISNATGTISGSTFTIDSGTGSWQLIIPGTTPSPIGLDCKRANGSFYGTDGKYVGGVFGMKTDSGYGVDGMFQGEKFSPSVEQ